MDLFTEEALVEAQPLETLGKLSARQEFFVAEYLKDYNATKAAIRAGYSATSAAETGCLLLKLPKISRCIDQAKEQRLARINITPDNVLQEMSLLAHSSIDHYCVDDDGQVQLTAKAPEGAMAAIQKVKRRKTVKMDKDENVFVTYDVEITLWDKPTPLKLIGRQVGLFADRVEHTGSKGGPIELAHLTVEQLLERHKLLSEAAAVRAEDVPSQE